MHISILVSYEIPHKTARHRRLERLELADWDSSKRAWWSCHQRSGCLDEQHQVLYGSSCQARSSAIRLSQHWGERRGRQACRRSSLSRDGQGTAGDIEAQLAERAVWSRKTSIDR